MAARLELGAAVDAAQQAVEHTRRGLFPFRFERWLALGFLAFLDQCGRGVGGGGGNFPSVPGRGGSFESAPFDDAASWLASHVAVVAAIAAGVLLLVVAVSALVLWLGSRGVFMYLDAVATGRADVGRPWREHRERAGSLFAWRFACAMAVLVFVVLLLGAAGFLFLMVRRHQLSGGPAVLVGVLVLLPLFLLGLLAASLFGMLLRDFVAPLQWLRGGSASEAVSEALACVKANPGAVAVYIGLKLVFAFAAAILGLMAGCLTCCLGFLPVVSQTLLQPLFFFERAWSLCLLQRLGHDVFAIGGSPREPAPSMP